MKARCQCGQLSAKLPEKPLIVIACHCLDCQRRTGAPFGVLAYYRFEQIKIEGDAKSYARTSAEGNAVETFFCPTCGSTVYVRLEKQPALVGVAVGTIADPAFRAPNWSVWEQSKHDWVEMPGNARHFERGDQPAG
ncbi:MAG TPA: GFA family protein [Rhizomicrobium sp.]|nr:GFA family protein [Rhizomicrobium sp.]